VSVLSNQVNYWCVEGILVSHRKEPCVDSWLGLEGRKPKPPPSSLFSVALLIELRPSNTVQHNHAIETLIQFIEVIEKYIANEKETKPCDQKVDLNFSTRILNFLWLQDDENNQTQREIVTLDHKGTLTRS
jgi:hypothetical protein